MIRRIELVNFMSHARTVIEPADGLTVLVGPNNCGKSAVVAALQILCHNDNSTYVTRHDAKECAVTIETDDGHVVAWKRKTAPRYEIDGKVFDRLGRDVPAVLHDVLRMPKVTAENSPDFDVHIGEQKSPVFLLDKPSSHAAQFFASSSDAASLVKMQLRHRQKTLDAARERADLQATSATLTAGLAALEAVETVGVGVARVEMLYSELRQSELRIERLTEAVSKLRNALAETARHAAGADALKPLPSPPKLPDPRPLAELIRQTTQTARERNAHAERGRSAVARLVPPPPWADTTTLAETVRALARAADEAGRTGRADRGLRPLTGPAALPDAGPLARCVADVTGAEAGLRACERDAAAARAALAAAADALRDWAERQQICPTCGGPLDADRLITRAALAARGGGRG